MSIINGYQNPRFTIRNNGQNVATIDLPLTNSAGLIESYSVVKQQVSTIEFKRKCVIYGFHITWQMNYDEYITGESMMLIKQILEYAKAGYTLILYPRKDHPWRNFEVYVSMDNFELGLRRGGIAAKAHRNVALEFSTVNLEPDLKWFSSDYIPNLTHVCNESIKFII
jgi:hypothetical protein